MFAANPGRSAPFTAIILAGQRPEGDPVAAAAGVEVKAFAPVGGRPMIHYVLEALADAGCVTEIVISTNHGAEMLADPVIADIAKRVPIHMIACAAQPVGSLIKAYEAHGRDRKILLATADNPMLTAATVQEFCAQANGLGTDMVVALANAADVQRAIPEGGRTNYRFRDISIGSCNLFALMTPRAFDVVHFWEKVQEDRKKVWKIVAAFGIVALIRMFFNRLTLSEAFRRAGKAVGATVAPVIVTDPYCGYDVDKAAHLAVVDRIMTDRNKTA